MSKAFTLVELMISLAMVLILILGINFVFRSATDAVGAGQALNGINSDAQSAQPVVFDDLQNVSKNPPCFIIASQLVTQFLNSDDAKTSSDPTKIITDNSGTTYYLIGNGTSTATVTYLSPAILDGRRHRADLLKFLAHANYHRRSGNDGTYYGSESSDDAFIELGHAALPTNDLTAFYGPSTLPNNTATVTYANGNVETGIPRLGAYASDWVLARRVTLLKDPTTIATGDLYYPTGGAAAPVGSNGAFAANMAPLSYGTLDNNSPTTAQTQLQTSRFDLAGITPDNFDRLIANAILTWENTDAYGGTNAAAHLWWNSLVYSFQLSQTVATHPQFFPPSSPSTSTVDYFPASPVYEYYGAAPVALQIPLNSSSGPIDPGLWYDRPQVNPNVQTPVTAATLAEMAPFFLQHCSQFIVEYAGDYMQQDNNPTDATYGAMTGLGPDGQIDYYLDAQGNKHIRWYGMPRSSTGVPHAGDKSGAMVMIRGFDPTQGGSGKVDDPTVAGVLNYFTDVIPLRDYYTMWDAAQTASTVKIEAPPWEVDVNFAPTRDYAVPVPAPGTVTDGRTGYLIPSEGTVPPFTENITPSRYVAAWHDDMPAMIRIIMKVDDPNNKVKDGPWYEYVFRLK